MLEIRPLMNSLPKLTDTYANVCGENNPFTDAPGVSVYGSDANTYHHYMLAFYGDLPVMADYAALHKQIVYNFTANAPYYAALYTARTAASTLNPLREMDYTETTTRTGHDDLNKKGTETNTRTGNIADSGTDSSTSGNTVTDSVKTYESASYKETAKTVSSGTGSLTHGKTTTYNNVSDARSFTQRTDETSYNSTFTKTVSGYKTNPLEMLEMYQKFAEQNNVFLRIIQNVVRDISCIVYIPLQPQETTEEE